MADNVMTFRLVVREVALEAGVHATFMPKPLASVQGSGMHTHFSLFEGDTNAFYDPGDERNLSKVGPRLHRRRAHPRPRDRRGHQPVGELLQAARRRLRGARCTCRWARNNRSVVVNVPPIKAGKADSARIEFRAPDPACNPYLAFSVVLAAGLKGIEEGYDLPAETSANLYQLTDEERLAEGIVDAARLAGRGARRDGALRAGGRGARRARVRVVHPQQAGRVAGVQDPGHASSSSTATCPRL